MEETNWSEVAKLLDHLYQSTDTLEALFPGRKFTLDGHLVGSVGEVVAAYMFDLDLNPASTQAHDAKSIDGRNVEIKLTQGRTVGLRHEPEHLVVLSRTKGTNISVIYNGPGEVSWNNAGRMQKNGQRSIGLAKLAALDAELSNEKKLPLVRTAPV